MELPEERAVEYFNSGYNCAESVLKAVVESMELGMEHPERVATPFGGGIGRQGHVCGCLTGAAMAVGLAIGRTAASDLAGKTHAYDAVARLFERFNSQAGAVQCRELTGLQFNETTHHQVCCPLVRLAVRITCEEIADLRRAGAGA